MFNVDTLVKKVKSLKEEGDNHSQQIFMQGLNDYNAKISNNANTINETLKNIKEF